MTGRARRIRVAGVPADFRLPRGWPTPSDRWVRDNAFWEPPPGWTPQPSLPAAPADWRFWTPNTLWSRTMWRHFHSIAPWIRVSNWLTYTWLFSMCVVTPILQSPRWMAVIMITLAAGALACFFVYEVLKARITKQVLVQFAVIAQRDRQQRLTREYQHYLTAGG